MVALHRSTAPSLSGEGMTKSQDVMPFHTGIRLKSQKLILLGLKLKSVVLFLLHLYRKPSMNIKYMKRISFSHWCSHKESLPFIQPRI